MKAKCYTKVLAKSLVEKAEYPYYDENMKSTFKIWTSDDRSHFELRVFEDDSEDYPYPHDMSYTVKGTLPSSLEGNATITEFIFQTIVQDDLHPIRLKSVFDVKPSDTVTKTTLASQSFISSSLLLVPPDYLFLHLEKNEEEQLVVKWRRFHRLWRVDQGGMDFLHDGFEQIIIFKESSWDQVKIVDKTMKSVLASPCTIM